MGQILGIISYLVVLSIIVKTVFKTRKRSEEATNPKASYSKVETKANASYKATNSSVPQRAKTSYKAVDSSVSQRPAFKEGSVNHNLVKEKGSSMLFDDRSNDWLARQIREENILDRKMAEMFSMRGTLHNSCEAEMIKRFHEENCDSKALKKEHREHCDAEGVDHAKA